VLDFFEVDARRFRTELQDNNELCHHHDREEDEWRRTGMADAHHLMIQVSIAGDKQFRLTRKCHEDIFGLRS
jgi:hypothetical protein